MKRKHPSFGDRLRNTMAGESNPTRDGYFVRVVYVPRGRMNAGTWYECTDGNGRFWQSNPETLVPLPIAPKEKTTLSPDQATSMADSITDELFDLGHLPYGPAHRIEFKGGRYTPDLSEERPLGGFSKAAFSQWLAVALAKRMITESPIAEETR